MSLIPVELEQQVVYFIRSLPPQPRQAIRRALRNLEREQGDIRALEADLEGFNRLRVERYRLIFFYHLRGGKSVIRLVYAAPRNIVYEIFAQQLRDILP